MGFEIDYLPVGQEANDKNGDAIAMRFWDTSPNNATVITIDGGTRESSKALVEHVQNYYKTTEVALAILSHPEADHVSGLRDVLEGLAVQNLYSIIPWNHADAILPIVQAVDARATKSSIETRLKEAYPAAVEAIEIAQQNGTMIHEPFAQTSPIGLTESTHMYLLGPTYDAYTTNWLPNYQCLPSQPAKAAGLLDGIVVGLSKATKWVAEFWNRELLVDPTPSAVSSENNSSLVFSIQQGNNNFLFCGDAGVPALMNALVHGHTLGLPVDGYSFFDVPHHGSRRNLGPTILNAMFGAPRPNQDCKKTATAMISINQR